MIPTIETIVEDLIDGKLSKSQAIAWLHQHAADAGRDLRDDFAAGALHPLIRITQKGGKTGPDADDSDFDWVARRAYAMADAMLKERAK